MNSRSMKAPVISELYNQKLIHSAHLKKLENIKQNRKTQLGFDKNRTQMIEHIRSHKARTFANNFNREHQQINQSNLKVVKKLQNVQPAPSITEHKRHKLRNKSRSKSQESFSLDNSINKMRNSRLNSLDQRRKRQNNEKQNVRLFAKLKSVSSNLNPQKLLDQHAKTEKVKQRLLRYSRNLRESNKIEIQLKSENFINKNTTPKSRYMSGFSSTKSRQHSSTVYNKQQNYTSLNSQDFKSRKGLSNTAHHYRKQDIIKNKIDNFSKNRYNASNVSNVIRSAKHTIQNEEQQINNILHNKSKVQQQGFFPTQIIKNKNALNFLKAKSTALSPYNRKQKKQIQAKIGFNQYQNKQKRHIIKSKQATEKQLNSKFKNNLLTSKAR